jgi:hypothetical protein
LNNVAYSLAEKNIRTAQNGCFGLRNQTLAPHASDERGEGSGGTQPKKVPDATPFGDRQKMRGNNAGDSPCPCKIRMQLSRARLGAQWTNHADMFMDLGSHRQSAGNPFKSLFKTQGRCCQA